MRFAAFFDCMHANADVEGTRAYDGLQMTKRLLMVALAMAGCGGGGIDEPIHDLVECRGGEMCELGCTGQREQMIGDCTATNPTSGTLDCGDPTRPLVESMGSLGCCFPQDGAFRFFVCEES